MNSKKLFFSYNFLDKDIIAQFYAILSQYSDLSIYFFDEVLHANDWEKEINNAIEACNYFILFMGSHFGKTQRKEVEIFRFLKQKKNIGLIKIELCDYNKSQFEELRVEDMGTIVIRKNTKNQPDYYTGITELLKNYFDLTFNFGDDLPSNPHLFDYEKTIIDFYIKKDKLCNKKIGDIKDLDKEKIDELIYGINLSKHDIRQHLRLSDIINIEYEKLSLNQKKKLLKSIIDEIHIKIKEGCPPTWPLIEPKDTELSPNKLYDIGEFRPKDASVMAAALSTYHKSPEKFCLMLNNLIFPEAGPRERLYYPKYSEGADNIFRVAIIVSGGIAPGINAVIDGITQRHYKYKEEHEHIEIWGLRKGFQAFQNINTNKVYLLSDEKYSKPDNRPELITSDHVNEGGSIIGTSREEKLLFDPTRVKHLEEIVRKLKSNHIRILYIIGGDGSMKAAHAISNIAKKFEYDKWDLSVIGIPKTMDNDILWVWQTFGFLSAVEKAREFVDHLAVEIKSNPRLGIVQLFGSDSGFVVSHAVLSGRTGICDIALIPEVPFSMQSLGNTLKEKFRSRGGNYGLVVMAETAIPTDAMNYVDYPSNLPEYINAKFYEEYLIKDISKDEIKLIEQYYKMDNKSGNYTLASKINEDIKDDIISIFYNTKYLNFINFYKLNSEDIENTLLSDGDNIKFQKNLKEKNWDELHKLLNSIGYYHYIEIDLSHDEKAAIKNYMKLRNRNQRIQGQTNDYLRTAGLKILGRGIQELNIDWGKNFRVLMNEPRHLLRAIPPSTIDIIFGSRLGTLAVDNAMAGYYDVMISQWLTEFVLVPLKLVVLGRKRIPNNGVFWKSVLSKTGQPSNLV